jgi:glycosyltransferase involved in cell wall biosynthesis
MSRVLVISFSDLARDARLERQIGFLTGHHEVVAAGLGPPHDDVEFIDLSVTPATGPARHLRRAGLAMRLLFRRYDSAYWSVPLHRRAEERLRGVPFDVVLANDVEALPLARRLAGARPVVFDAHEWAIGQYEHIRWWRLLARPQVDALLRSHLPGVAGMTTIAPGIAELYERRYGVRPRVVTNAAPRADLRPTPAGDPIRLLHHGGAHPVRRLELMIEAVERLGGRMTLDLALLPNDPGYLRRLTALAASSPHIRVIDPIPLPELVTRANGYDAGLIFFPPVTENLAHTLPNKLFELLQARVAVVTGPSPEIESIVREFDCGVVAPAFTVDALASTLGELTPGRIDELKQGAGRAAEVHNAEANAGVVLEVVDEALRGRAAEGRR